MRHQAAWQQASKALVCERKIARTWHFISEAQWIWPLVLLELLELFKLGPCLRMLLVQGQASLASFDHSEVHVQQCSSFGFCVVS